MLYLKCISDDLFGIFDTDDNGLEFINYSYLDKLVRLHGDNFIRGCYINSNNLLAYEILDLNCFPCDMKITKGVFGLTICSKYNLKSMIVGYKNYTDFVCKLETGVIYNYSNLQSFKKGNLLKGIVDIRDIRIGETNISCYGQKMTIIDYTDSSNVTVKFEDESIRYNIEYGAFKRGFVRNNNKRIGEISVSCKGELMYLTDYIDSKNITIRFEDDTVVYKKSYDHFLRGEIKNPNYYKNLYEGYQMLASNGQIMTIVKYISYDNSIIEFQDGTKVNGNLSHFFKGCINNPNYTTNEYKGSLKEGDTSISLHGQLITLISYRSFKDIDVEFEDGYTAYGVRYDHFKNGLLLNPNVRGKSLFERIFDYYISLTGLSYIFNYRPSWLNGMEIDIFLPDLNIAIEIDGFYHSNEEQHERDIKKNKLLNNKSIKVIRIRDFNVCKKFKSDNGFISINLDIPFNYASKKFIFCINRALRMLYKELDIKVLPVIFNYEILDLCKRSV